MQKSYGVIQGPQGRPRIITKVHDLWIKEEAVRLKQYKANDTSRKNVKNCIVEAAR